MKNINSKELAKGILIICSYLILSFILQIPFIFLPEKYIYLFTYLSLTIVYILYNKKDLIEDFKNFKKDWKSILKTTTIYWLIGLIIMLTSSFIINKLNIPSNTINQVNNITLLEKMPLIAIMIMVVFAPIIEELVFRKGLINFTKNKHLFAISSGLIFALLHLVSSFQSINDIIMIVHLIPYSAVGIAFGYAYFKTKNIYGPIIIHSFHNILSIIEIIILGGIL